jgi:superfamily II DNA/RNA helicase
MSMEGLRDFSVIATAPQKRLAIKTFVSNFSDGIIREAVLRELKRGGQVYFLHNEVDTIANMQEKLEKLVPEARIVIGHGQMNERELERVMRDFTGQRANVLLCTTIIETGIDNPHANTILINRSEKFGLAQLHQLRGRVGRSHHQAYAYLLVQDEKAMTKQAKHAPRSDPGDGRTRFRLLPRHARPGNPRRRRSARRQPVGRNAGSRLQYVHRHAQPRGRRTETGQTPGGSRPDTAARDRQRNKPAHPGPAARRLLPRRP